MTKPEPLQCWQKLRRVERELDLAIKVRNLLIVVGKITATEFEEAEALVRNMAPDSSAEVKP